MSEVKQVICMRSDLKMRRGKECAQSAHASMKVLLDMMVMSYGDDEDLKDMKFTLTVPFQGPVWEWLEGSFTKVCVSVESEQELHDLYQQAKKANIPCAMIVDAGKTEFGGVPTKTCIAIGPWHSEEINKITGHLKLR